MKHVWNCRRSFIAFVAIGCLTGLGFFGDAEVAGAIATVALAVAGANAAEKSFNGSKKDD